jgi:hypothetical protein
MWEICLEVILEPQGVASDDNDILISGKRPFVECCETFDAIETTSFIAEIITAIEEVTGIQFREFAPFRTGGGNERRILSKCNWICKYLRIARIQLQMDSEFQRKIHQRNYC